MKMATDPSNWLFGDLEVRKEDCRYELEESLETLLYRYGPVVLREQIWRWLEKAPRNRVELEERGEKHYDRS